MRIDFSELSPTQRYHIMTQTIVPRPVAWVLTDSAQEGEAASYNLAPFSYFNALSSDPALVMISAGAKPNGDVKDTRVNILERKRMVIHIPSVEDAEAVTNTAENLDFGISETEKYDLPLVTEAGWSLPRLRDSKIAMYAEYYDHTEIGPRKQAIIFCEIKDIYVSDEAASMDEKGRVKVDATKMNPLSRLGANQYASFGEVFSLTWKP